MESERLFDQEYYLEINRARWKAAAHVLAQLDRHALRTCLDVGCGPGWFTERLAATRDWDVRGLDGRADLIEDARRRVPAASFVVGDFESDFDLAKISPADLVFCFGLLYHLENPFKAIRSLHRLTVKILMLETQIIPRTESMFWLVEEGRNETQGLTHMAVIPTRASLIKMLCSAGFDHVYEYTGTVDHVDFQDTAARRRRRTIMIAGNEELQIANTVRVQDVPAPKYDYSRATT